MIELRNVTKEYSKGNSALNGENSFSSSETAARESLP